MALTNQPILRLLILGTLALVIAPSRASAQALTPNLVARAVEASVLVSCEHGEGRSEGSGTLIHSDGYVLTNFHVVGHVHPFAGGVPGALFNPDGEVTLWHAASSREESRPRWTGRVILGDPSLDLAIIRLASNVDGTPVTALPRPLPIERDPGELSDRVFAVGFPVGMRSVSLNSGQVTGFDLDASGNPTFIRVDAEFNPGNSGGGLLNLRGELIGVPTQVSRERRQISPIEKARPVSLIPPEWFAAMDSGTAEVSIAVAPELSTQAQTIHSTGSGFVVRGEELFFFRVPRGFQGTVRFDVDHSGGDVHGQAALVALERPRQIIRTAQSNGLAVSSADLGSLMVIATVRRRTETGQQTAAADVNIHLDSAVFVAGDARSSGSVGSSGGPTTTLEPRPTFEARPNASQGRRTRYRRNTFTVGGGAVVDPLEGEAFFNGGVVRLTYQSVLYHTDPERKFRFSFEFGVRILAGSWRSDAVFYATALAGLRLSMGSPDLSFEIPINFTLGGGLAEDHFGTSLYGYDIGAFIQTGWIGYGLTWSESQRGEFSVLRALSANVALRF